MEDTAIEELKLALAELYLENYKLKQEVARELRNSNYWFKRYQELEAKLKTLETAKENPPHVD